MCKLPFRQEQEQHLILSVAAQFELPETTLVREIVYIFQGIEGGV